MIAKLNGFIVSVKCYTDIIIYDNRFLMVECVQKPQGKSALSTLLRIEEVMKKGLQYTEVIEDEFSQLPRHELYAALRQRAEAIRDGYVEKATELSSFNRFFGQVSKKEQVIQAMFDRIVNLAEPAPVLELPNELIQRIFGFLQTSDLGRIAQVNKHGESHVEQAEIQRAREYGYSGRDFAEAKNYLHNLFQSISTLVKDGCIPEKYVARKGRWPFWCYVDSEATLRNIKRLTFEEAEALKAHFSEVLLANVKKGRLETVRALLQYGANPNILNGQGKTPLMLVRWNKELIQLLLDNGADPNIADNRGFTPLPRNTSDPVITNLLCERGANVDHQTNQGGYTALHYAARKGRLETVRALLQYGANPNIINIQGKTPLMLARWNKELIQLLLDSGADPNLADNRRVTPLTNNISDPVITNLLCERGANVDHTNQGGNTALHYAAKKGQLETVRVLLQYGANPNVLNNQGKTPYQLARLRRIRYLLQSDD